MIYKHVLKAAPALLLLSISALTLVMYPSYTSSKHDSILACKRSNNELDVSKMQGALSAAGLQPVPHISEAIVGVFERMKVNLGGGQEGGAGKRRGGGGEGKA